MNTVLESIKQAKIYSHPWPHYEIRGIFDSEVCNWINTFNFPTNEEIFKRKTDWFMSKKTERVGAVGIKQYIDAFKQRYQAAKEAIWHKKTHPCEFIFGTDFLQKHIYAQRIVDMFLDLNVIKSLESLENVKLDK